MLNGTQIHWFGIQEKNLGQRYRFGIYSHILTLSDIPPKRDKK